MSSSFDLKVRTFHGDGNIRDGGERKVPDQDWDRDDEGVAVTKWRKNISASGSSPVGF
jgi:hypothetical protein